MTKSWNPRRGKKRYERAGSVALNSVRLGQAPVSLSKIRWRHRGLWILLGVVILAGAVGLWLTMDSRFYVYDAQIQGTRRLSQQAVFDASGLRGLHILWARPATIESQTLEALPSLESVEVNCQFPSECSISVVERRPRVLWDDGGERWWIDEQGTVFLMQAEGLDSQALTEASGGWTVNGPLPRDGEGNLEGHVLVGLAELWESGRQLPGAFQYSPDQGLSFIDGHGWRVVVGVGAGMNRRLQVLDRMVSHLESRQVTPRYVDVRFPEAPYYAPRAD